MLCFKLVFKHAAHTHPHTQNAHVHTRTREIASEVHDFEVLVCSRKLSFSTINTANQGESPIHQVPLTLCWLLPNNISLLILSLFRNHMFKWMKSHHRHIPTIHSFVHSCSPSQKNPNTMQCSHDKFKHQHRCSRWCSRPKTVPWMT